MFQWPSAVRTRLTVGVGVAAEGDSGELGMAAAEGGEAERDADLVGAQDGLGAEGGILVDDEVFQGEAGQREQRRARRGRNGPGGRWRR